MKISIRHRMTIGLGSGQGRAVHHLLLTPQSGPTQTVQEWRIEMAGFAEAAQFTDAFGNQAQLVSQHRPEGEIVVAVTGQVETHDTHGVLGRPAGEPVPALFRRVTPATKPMGTIAGRFRGAPKDGQHRIGLLHGLMERCHTVLGGAEQSQVQGEAGQSQTQGAAQRPAADYAHAFVGVARALGIPARYVTGYLAGSDGEAAGLHAWAEAWDDGLGWIGFDAMLNLCPAEQHVRLAMGLDAESTMPIRSVPALGTPQVLEMRVAAGQ